MVKIISIIGVKSLWACLNKGRYLRDKGLTTYNERKKWRPETT
jgi:hypothetical protein